jgi:hypothetical protein
MSRDSGYYSLGAEHAVDEEVGAGVDQHSVAHHHVSYPLLGWRVVPIVIQGVTKYRREFVQQADYIF